MACLILQMPNNYLPIFSDKQSDSSRIYGMEMVNDWSKSSAFDRRVVPSLFFWLIVSVNLGGGLPGIAQEPAGTPEGQAAPARWSAETAVPSRDMYVSPPADAPGASRTGFLADGSEFVGHLVTRSEQGTWFFAQAGQRIEVAGDQLVIWGTARDRSRKASVFLTDGSLLVAELLSIDQNNLVLAGRLWSDVKIPRAMLKAIVLRPAMGPQARDQLYYRALTGQRSEDELLLENGDELKGTLPAELKPEPGAFHPSSMRWPVRGAGQVVDMPLDRVSAILLANDRTTIPPGTNVVWVGFTDGSRLLAKHMTQVGKSLEFQLACGARLVTDAGYAPAGEPYGAVTMLQPLSAAVTYVSDLEALGYKHIPFFSVTWPYWNDRSVTGGQLRQDGRVYVKGLGMHSSSRLAYRLDGQYRWLQAELALDDLAGREGSVIYRVYAQDAAGQWTKAYDSGIVRGGQPSIAMHVDVTGGKPSR